MQFSDIPNVTQLLGLSIFTDVQPEWATHVVRIGTADVRLKIREGEISTVWTMEDWAKHLNETMSRLSSLRYKRVINGTGIVVHTNLGRAPLSVEVLEYMKTVSQYTDLELRLSSGKRGGRLLGIREKIRQITGAEDALVVNNNAAAVLLTVSAIASGKEVIVSRGELVEIGGSFRIPEVIQQGGAILKEVGCTNRTRVSDVAEAISERSGAILRVHPSNYHIVGFTERPMRHELAKVATSNNVPLIDDLGSGLLKHAPNVPWKEQLEREESISVAIQTGADLVCASGDKLLGGVQAGFIVGRADLVERCRRHPLYRALRLDKMLLAALEATLQIHLEGRSSELPVWRFLERSQEECKRLAEMLMDGMPEYIHIKQDVSLVGGGASPERVLPTWVLEISTPDAAACAYELRVGTPAIMTRVHRERVLLDVRTIEVEDVHDIKERLRRCVHPV